MLGMRADQHAAKVTQQQKPGPPSTWLPEGSAENMRREERRQAQLLDRDPFGPRRGASSRSDTSASSPSPTPPDPFGLDGVRRPAHS
eukprot:gene1522-10098_t